MKPVIQEDMMGCGIASIATLAGVSYQQSKQVAHELGIEVSDSRLWSDTIYIRKLLTHYHIQPSETKIPFTTWETVPFLALLAIKWRQAENNAFWRWVVFWQSPNGPVVFDSKQALHIHNRTDFGRIKPKWFISLTLPL